MYIRRWQIHHTHFLVADFLSLFPFSHDDVEKNRLFLFANENRSHEKRTSSAFFSFFFFFIPSETDAKRDQKTCWRSAPSRVTRLGDFSPYWAIFLLWAFLLKMQN
jgi:hypothetical protein